MRRCGHRVDSGIEVPSAVEDLDTQHGFLEADLFSQLSMFNEMFQQPGQTAGAQKRRACKRFPKLLLDLGRR